MTWQCFAWDTFNFEDESTPWPPVGAMWYTHSMPTTPDEFPGLAPEYWRDHFPARRPIVVMMPSKNAYGEIVGFPFTVDSKQRDEHGYKDCGWTVTGDIPNVTVSPSINAVGIYHGWLQNGVISDGIIEPETKVVES